MKKQIIILAIIFSMFVTYGQSQKTNTDSSQVSFYKAYDALKGMLEGKDTLNYEKAVFITENAYYNNQYDYKDFKKTIDFHVGFIKFIAENTRTYYKEKYKGLRSFEQQAFKANTDNWAIYKYITDTVLSVNNNYIYYKDPYTYTNQDPYGSNKWENTQIMHLLTWNEMQGNCYSLAVLFKLFSDRLKSDARLTITPNHIYIQNRNARGDFNNVELASKTFPGDGLIQTLTYTTRTSIMNGMAQRMLNDKEAVALNLIYLAKSYQHKYNDNTNEFLLQCADLAFKYDTLSLNALLLKAEVTENRLLAAMKENKISKLSKVRTNSQTQKLLANYEKQLSNLYSFGYIEIPKDIEHLIIAKIQHRDVGAILNDKTPNPFASIKAKQRYATLSNGLFDEMHEPVDTIQYYHALLNTKTNKIIRLLPNDTSNDYKVDPVIFALSVDPMSDKYPSISPYAYCLWNPVIYTDPDGRWVPDADGNLIAEKGDNATTLAKFQNIKYIDALKQLKSQGYKVNDKGILNLKIGNKVTLNNVYTESIKNSTSDLTTDAAQGRAVSTTGATPEDWYNCWGSAIAGSQGQKIEVGVGIGDGKVFDNKLSSDYTPNETNAEFGKTVIRFANEDNKVQHGAVFYGKSKDGTMYVYTKNGWYYKPEIMKLSDLQLKIPSYGTIQGINKGNSGFYNHK